MFTLAKANKHYVSDVDRFLEEFNKTHPKSESQKAEIKKHWRIFQLRDHADHPDHPIDEEAGKDIWE